MAKRTTSRSRRTLAVGALPIMAVAMIALRPSQPAQASGGAALASLPSWVTALPHTPGGVYDLPDSQLTGYTILHPASIKSLADGGVDIIYNVNGVETHFPVAPPSFHPLTAPDWQLALYGFSRPSAADAAAIQRWQANAAAYTHTVPVTRLLLPKEVQVANGGTDPNATKDPSHSGYNSFYDGQHQFTEADMYWTEPSWTPCDPNKAWAASIWPGLENQGTVTQDGTETVQVPGSSNNLSHQVWYETYPAQPGAIPLPGTIPAGHSAYAVVQHDVNATTSSYVVQDQTTGARWVHSDTAVVPGTFWAFWDIERPKLTVTQNGNTSSFFPDMPRFANFNNRGYWDIASIGLSGGIGDWVLKFTATNMVGTNTSQPIIAAPSTLVNSGSSNDTFTEMPIANVCS